MRFVMWPHDPKRTPLDAQSHLKRWEESDYNLFYLYTSERARCAMLEAFMYILKPLAFPVNFVESRRHALLHVLRSKLGRQIVRSTIKIEDTTTRRVGIYWRWKGWTTQITHVPYLKGVTTDLKKNQVNVCSSSFRTITPKFISLSKLGNKLSFFSV